VLVAFWPLSPPCGEATPEGELELVFPTKRPWQRYSVLVLSPQLTNLSRFALSLDRLLLKK
jgi:hypothetical protein